MLRIKRTVAASRSQLCHTYQLNMQFGMNKHLCITSSHWCSIYADAFHTSWVLHAEGPVAKPERGSWHSEVCWRPLGWDTEMSLERQRAPGPSAAHQLFQEQSVPPLTEWSDAEFCQCWSRGVDWEKGVGNRLVTTRTLSCRTRVTTRRWMSKLRRRVFLLLCYWCARQESCRREPGGKLRCPGWGKWAAGSPCVHLCAAWA